MSAISSNPMPPGGGMPLPLTESATTGASAPVTNPDLLKELADMAASLAAAKGGADAGDGVSNGKGAPALDAPATALSAGDLLDLLRTMRSKSQDAQLTAAKESLETARGNAQKNNKHQAE